MIRSDFVLKNIEKHPDFFQSFKNNQFDAAVSFERLEQALMAVSDLEELKKRVRIWRNQEWSLVAIRDLSGEQGVLETCLQISLLAEIALKQTLELLKKIKNSSADLDILLMGKLGGRELNFSSDVDLIFVDFSEAALEQDLNFLLRDFVSVLNDTTPEGFVFRVDLRLRPFGQQGPLLMTEAQLIRYYQEHGRDWERYALMKARFLIQKRETCEKALQKFVYQGAPDYSMRQAILKLYQAIQKEQKDPKRHQSKRGVDIKLGVGGIREAEFIVQALQLMHAGQEKIFYQRGFVQALSVLVSQKILSEWDGAELEAAYLFLRNLENKLQMYADQQTHLLPALMSSHFEFYLLSALKIESIAVLNLQLQNHQQKIIQLRQKYIDLEQSPSALPKAVWSVPKQKNYFEELKAESPLCQSLLAGLKQPCLEAVRRHPNPEKAEAVLMDFLRSIQNKKSYLSLLNSNTRQLDRLLVLLVQSEFLKKLVMTYPRVLSLLWVPDESEPRSMRDLRQSILHHLPGMDQIEDQLNYLQEQKLFQLCRIAISDLEHRYPIMRVSDFLTELAEVIVQAVCELAWHEMIDRYGFPAGISHSGDFGFSVIAYGKLGGLELSYTSDLDLVFIYQYAEGCSNGEVSISQQEFYSKLSRLIIQYLQNNTPYGLLYQVDNRLRPSGQSGLLATPMASFSEYQRHSAWTWEHQALLRARPIFSNLDLNAHFEQIRLDILCRARDPQKLKQEVRQMREKMRQMLDMVGHQEPSVALYIKQMPGGMIDIEFLVQYLALQYAHQYPILVRYTDNIRILENLAAVEVLSLKDSQQLMEIYRQYRNYLHQATLLGVDHPAHQAVIELFHTEKAWVWKIFNDFLGLNF